MRVRPVLYNFLSLRSNLYCEGCMIVETLDYRPPGRSQPILEQPERSRIVLHPNSETLYADICLMNKKAGGKWSDQQALEFEAKFIVGLLDVVDILWH